jgi:hypothetical protein
MATTQDLLDQATTAYNALLTGTALVSVQYGDRKIDYTPANRQQLERYIGQLRRQIAGKTSVRNRISYMVPD